jgi:hypothetical protein
MLVLVHSFRLALHGCQDKTSDLGENNETSYEIYSKLLNVKKNLRKSFTENKYSYRPGCNIVRLCESCKTGRADEYYY